MEVLTGDGAMSLLRGYVPLKQQRERARKRRLRPKGVDRLETCFEAGTCALLPARSLQVLMLRGCSSPSRRLSSLWH